MSYPIEQHITRVNKGGSGTNNPEWIIIHFVGASGQARSNANYFYNVYRGASAHYFVDPNDIIQVVPDRNSAWHIGDGSRTGKGQHNGYVNPGGATNTNSIGIEGCQDTSTGNDVWHWDFHPKTVDKIEWLVRKLQDEYGIDDDHVIRHYDASGKMCPGNWQWDNWGEWWNFKSRLNKSFTQPTPTGNDYSEGKSTDRHMHLVETGETLYSIAKENGRSVEQLTRWNDLENPELILPETRLFVDPPSTNEPSSDIEQIARDVIDGKYGNGEQRRAKLGSKYDEVQDMINSILLGTNTSSSKTITELANEVIDGKHGTGDARKRSLGSDYDEVQARVNEILSGDSPAPRSKSIDTLALEVINGKHGSGDARKKSLGSKYNKVQARVNSILQSGTTSSKTVSELADEVIQGKHGSGKERMKSLGSMYSKVQAEVNRRYR